MAAMVCNGNAEKIERFDDKVDGFIEELIICKDDNEFEKNYDTRNNNDTKMEKKQEEVVEKVDVSQDNKPEFISDNPEIVYGHRYRIFYPPHIRKSVSPIVPDSDLWYNMTSFPRGRMVIINMTHFSQSTGLDRSPRNGTGADIESLVLLFLKLGFVIDVYEDIDKDELLRVMSKASRASYKRYGAFICAILTRGEDEKLIHARDGIIETRELLNMFGGPNLVGKPKIFLVQACQGVESSMAASIDEYNGDKQYNEDKQYDGDNEYSGDKNDGDKDKVERHNPSLQIDSDFVYAYSTLPGNRLWGGVKMGSWFIQTLCKVFREHAQTTDIIRLLAQVSNLAAEKQLSLTDEDSLTDDVRADNNRHYLNVVSQLSKEFYFFPPS